jgi:hypothetical protein
MLARTLIENDRNPVNQKVRDGFYNYLSILKATELLRTRGTLRLPLAVQKVFQDISAFATNERDWCPSSQAEVLECVIQLCRRDEERSPAFKDAQVKAYWYEQSLNNFFDQRRVFITGGGRTGIGPKSLDVGDEVGIVPSCEMPWILRRKACGNEFLAMGDAFVYGIMYGEVVARKTEEDLVNVVLI